MSGRMAPAWFRWCEARLTTNNNRLDNLEESLMSYKIMQRRMLFAIITLVIINGFILLFN
tara:strand:+ start:1004 stop:1183 length:180 start_codon:yes stop_codon:yes gene_type:complete